MQPGEETTAAVIARMADMYADDVYRMCCMMLRDEHLAQDACQETFLRAQRYYDRFRRECSEKTWLITICVRVCRNMLRAPWRRYENPYIQAESLARHAAEDTGVLSAVMALEHKYRTVILLHYYMGVKTKDIAAALHVPKNTVTTRLKRAREQLKQQLMEGGMGRD